MKKTPLLLCMAGGFVCLAGVPNLHAQSADALIDKLVEKGILNVKEANELRDEADKNFNIAHSVKTGMPEWVTAFKINGDFRGRYEGFYNRDSAFTDRNRFRYRARIGFTAAMFDKMEVGIRLGSGDATAAGGFIDPISSNQTFDNNGAKKGVYIDLAYAKWTPLNTADWVGGFTFGKMENPFVVSEMVFDGDYTPEGLASQWTYRLTPNQEFKLNAGGFVLDELSGSNRDPYLLAAQLRWEANWLENKLQSSLGLAAFAVSSQDGLGSGAVPDINVGNTRTTGGNLVHHYNPVLVDGSLTYNLATFPFYTGAFPIKAGGEYMQNPGAPKDNEAWAMGLTFGKAGKRRTWEISYRYKVLEADAWYEEFVDSDSGAYYPTAYPNSGQKAGYRSGTNIRGHVARFAYSPYDSLTLSATYFLLGAINESPRNSESEMGRLQLDAVWKF